MGLPPLIILPPFGLALVVGYFTFNVLLPNALEGIIVRLEAQYGPKIVQLDPETNERAPRRENDMSSWLVMHERVGRIEGWRGILKGLWPAFIAMVLDHAVRSLVVWLYGGRKTWAPFILKNILGKLAAAPFRIITYQAITTPEVLSVFDLKRAIDVFLSPDERRRPWLIYFTPGILPLVLFQAVYTFPLPYIGRYMLTFSETPFFYTVSPRALIRFGYSLMYTAIHTPVHVMFVRLAIQRNRIHTPPPASEEKDAVQHEKLAEPSNAKVQVLEYLRTQQRPYAGLWDCAKSIVAEEGFWTFYRTWWWSLTVSWRNTSYTTLCFVIHWAMTRRPRRSSSTTEPPSRSAADQ
ncbi:hypothetical protein F5I97DRAFT_1905030 [Phlebopus sp. FC_14]|nr:hypothetical protein F5I97DRAFT_1905030 [Phlebopus sp. FC_14]